MPQISSIPGPQPQYPPVFGRQEIIVPPNEPVTGETAPVLDTSQVIDQKDFNGRAQTFAQNKKDNFRETLRTLSVLNRSYYLTSAAEVHIPGIIGQQPSSKNKLLYRVKVLKEKVDISSELESKSSGIATGRLGWFIKYGVINSFDEVKPYLDKLHIKDILKTIEQCIGSDLIEDFQQIEPYYLKLKEFEIEKRSKKLEETPRLAEPGIVEGVFKTTPLHERLLFKSIEKGLIKNQEVFKRYSQDLDEKGTIPLKTFKVALKKGLIGDVSEIYAQAELQKEKGNLSGAVSILLCAYKEGLIPESQRPDLDFYFNAFTIKSSEDSFGYADVVNDCVESGYFKSSDEFISRVEFLNTNKENIVQRIISEYNSQPQAQIDVQMTPEHIKQKVELMISQLLMNAYKNGTIAAKLNVQAYFQELAESKRWAEYPHALEVAIKSDLIRDEAEFTALLKPLVENKAISNATEVILLGQAAGFVSDLKPYFKEMIVAGGWNAGTLVRKGIESGAITDKADVGFYLRNLESNFFTKEECVHIVEAALKKGIYTLDEGAHEELIATAKSHGVPLSYVIAVNDLSQGLGLDDTQVAELYKQGGDLFGAVNTINTSSETRDDQRIEFFKFENFLSPALVNLLMISEKSCCHILDANLTQRRNLLLLSDIFEQAAFLTPDEVSVLNNFATANQELLNREPTFLIDLIGYLNAYNALGLGLNKFEEDTNGTQPSIGYVANNLGKNVIKALCNPENLNINVDVDKLTEGRNLLKEWDIRYLGLLAASKSAWNPEERKLCALLIKSKLEGTEKGLLCPPDYSKYDVSVYGTDDETKALVLKIRRHNLNLLREMEEKGLNVKAWLKPNEAVEPIVTSPDALQKRPVDLLRKFKISLEAFKRWLKENPDSERKDFSKIEKKMGSWARIGDNPSPKMFDNKNCLESLEAYVKYVSSKCPFGNIPEEVTDMSNMLTEIKYFDPTKKIIVRPKRIRFSYNDPGFDLFLSNRAKSCTSLGSNATARFQFCLDIGTLDAIIEDPEITHENPNGRPEGYSRTFLAYNDKNEPILFVDSTDGTTAGLHFEQMTKHVTKLANKLGLDESHVVQRVLVRSTDKTLANDKLGGALCEPETSPYFNHAGPLGRAVVFRPRVLPTDLAELEKLDNWKPKDGWS